MLINCYLLNVPKSSHMCLSNNIYRIICPTEWCILLSLINPLCITCVVFLWDFFFGLLVWWFICVPGIPPEDYSWSSVVPKLSNRISLKWLCSSTVHQLSFENLQSPISLHSRRQNVTNAHDEILPLLMFHCCFLLLCCYCKLCTAKLWPELAEQGDLQ